MDRRHLSDPGELALLTVQQYLRENGYEQALQAIERSTGVAYVEEKLPRGSMLLEMIHEKMEREIAEDLTDLELADRAEDEELLRSDARDWPHKDPTAVDGLHTSNILAVTLWMDEGLAFTGSGDRTVRCLHIGSKTERWSRSLDDGAILALALHPSPGEEPWLLASCMGGSVHLLHARSGEHANSVKAHTKYVHRVCWAAEGALFASASFDASLRVFEWPADPDLRASPLPEAWNAVFPSTVEDIQLLKDSRQEAVLAVATQNNHCLHLLDLCARKELPKVNMNAHGDSHVSFVAKHLALSACAKYLLVSTDIGRILMLNTSSWRQVRNFYGLPCEQFSNPCAAFSPSCQNVYAIATGGQVWVFQVSSGKVVAKLEAHAINVRYLQVDARHGCLATCSYDKTVKLWPC
mmetsp:Transcript_20517/g.53667  ORF Transcript_20517/g.53667 Transcript_20517/m.53667 type:complete len:409 (-) Transcript_20517:284-1510(-)